VRWLGDGERWQQPNFLSGEMRGGGGDYDAGEEEWEAMMGGAK
jgi:hypothetical protein